MADEGQVFLLALIAIIFPPAAVAFMSGCSSDLCINILLTILGWLPGCIHAFWLVLKRSEANEKYGYKNWSYMGNGRYRIAEPKEQQPYVQPPPQAEPAAPAPATEEPKSQGYTAPPQQPPPEEQKA